MSILKIIGIIILVLIVIFIGAQIYFSMMSSDIESYEYEVIKEYDNFEIRLYEEALFSYVTMPYSSYRESSGQGFRILAGYIFGGFADDEKIQKHKEKLKNLLEEKGIKHSNDFSYLGYNPPYELFGRRNEVVVEIDEKSF